MDKKKQAIILGALLHDIGKFMQRAEVPCHYGDDKRQMQLVCKYHKEGGYFTCKHSLWTVEFFEKYQTHFPAMPFRFENSDDNLANFASKHHNPHTPLQWIVAEADRLSSGMDRLPGDEEDEIRGKDRFKKIRLSPVLEEIVIDGKKRDKTTHRIELHYLTLDKDIIFPRNLEDLTPKKGELLVENYERLWEQFIREFILIPNDNFFAFIETLLFLLEKYTWCIPSSTIDLPDISLFDHSKTTAAITACLYDYHSACNGLEEKKIRNRHDSKYLLVCGDLSGIQKFIYNITSKGAAKGLKGRSFFLQLLADATGKYILRRFDYPFTNLLYASGGKFYLLVSNRYENELTEIRKDINLELLQRLGGEIYLSLGWCYLKGSDFKGINFPPKWREAAQQANEQKNKRFSDLDYHDVFNPSGKGGKEETCQICKREGEVKPRKEDEPEIKLCPDCEEKERLGEWLSGADYLVEIFGNKKMLNQKYMNIPFLDTKYFFLNDLKELKSRSLKNAIIYKLNSTKFLGQEFQDDPCGYGFKFVGGTYLPRGEDQKPLTFNNFAERSTGLKRLGILRMDVDNLGLIFSRGFAHASGDTTSISRVTTLSRNLSLFFNGYLNTICLKGDYKEKTYIIYSGGDDLFIVGEWNPIIDLAEDINSEFQRFCCRNPCLTLSGGIALVTKKYPIYRGAKHAGVAEDKAKKFKRKNGKEKNAITFLDKPLSWHDFAIARDIKNFLYKQIRNDKKDGRLSKGILDRLRRIYLLYENDRAYWRDRKSLPLDQIKEKLRYHKWLWRSVYTLYKAAKENELFQEELQLLRTALLENRFNDKKSEREIIEFIDIPTRWVEFLLREEE